MTKKELIKKSTKCVWVELMDLTTEGIQLKYQLTLKKRREKLIKYQLNTNDWQKEGFIYKHHTRLIV